MRRGSLAELLLPLRPWLSAESSIGIEEGQGGMPDLLKLADRAMYEAKRAGKGCYRFAAEA